MDDVERGELEEAGFRIGTAAEFLGLTVEEEAEVEERLVMSRPEMPEDVARLIRFLYINYPGTEPLSHDENDLITEACRVIMEAESGPRPTTDPVLETVTAYVHPILAEPDGLAGYLHRHSRVIEGLSTLPDQSSSDPEDFL